MLSGLKALLKGITTAAYTIHTYIRMIRPLR